MALDPNDFRPGDLDNNVLRKILQRLKDVIAAVKGQGSPIIGPITISPEDIEIGAVEIKDSTTDDRTKVIDVAPVGNEFAVVVRNIPSGTQPISAVSLPLPAGASTEATLATRLADATLTARLNVLGQNTMANSAPVVIASDQSAIPISAASLPLPTGAATEATLATRLADATFTARVPAALVGGRFDVNLGAWLGSTAPTVGQKVSASSLPVVIASDQTAVPVSGTVTITPSGTQTVAGNKTNNNAAPGATNIGSLGAIANAAAPVWTEGFLVAQSVDLAGNLRVINPVQLPAALVGGRLDTNIGSWLGSTAPTVGLKSSANSIPVVLASDTPTLRF